jgi:hypothetical protein
MPKPPSLFKATKIKAEDLDLVKRYQDLLEIARLVSWCMNRDHLIKTCLDHINQRLGKFTRKALYGGLLKKGNL